MGILGGSLRGRVARRVFGLFVVCALVPIIGLAVVSFFQVRSQLTHQSREKLRDTAKGKALGVFERLAFVETELALLAAELADGEEGFHHWNRAMAQLEVGRRFDGLVMVKPEAITPLDGKGEIYPRFSRSQEMRLAEGGTVLHTSRDQEGRARIWMARPVPDNEGGKGWVAALVRADYLWAVDDLPPMRELTIFDGGGDCLFSTLSGSELESLPAAREATQSALTGSRSALVSSRFELPLRFAFGSPSWTVVISEPGANVFRSASQFMKAFPLVVLLSLWVVLFLSIVQIRRSLNPLERLKEGTGRIGAGLFDTRVFVRSGDEFEELAESMNGMARRLGRQFHALSTTAEIDRALLSALHTDEVISRLLRGLFRIVSAERATITLVGEEGQRQWRTFSSSRETPESVAVTDPELSPAILGKLDDAHSGLVLSNASVAGEGRSASSLLLPVVLETRISAVLALQYGEQEQLTDEEREQARRMVDRLAVALTNARLIERVDRLSWGALVALARAIDAKSPWTAGHSERAARIAVAIGKRMDLDQESLDIIHRGGLLHDIGKIGIPPTILDKKGKLTEKERAIMQEHPVIGARILEPIEAYARYVPVVLQHHEWFDGSGYPEGVSGESISLYARVYAVADVYDALFADRPYRAGLGRKDVVDYIVSRSRTQFDPQVVRSFLAIVATHPVDLEDRTRHLHRLTGAFATAPAFRSQDPEEG